MAGRPASIAEAFILNAGRSPNKLCLRFEGEEWTYERLREHVGTFAGVLRTWGLKPGGPRELQEAAPGGLRGRFAAQRFG
jgi:acyl-CoA synthetase (AMP-forming)/AMP-acid ligase II